MNWLYARMFLNMIVKNQVSPSRQRMLIHCKGLLSNWRSSRDSPVLECRNYFSWCGNQTANEAGQGWKYRQHHSLKVRWPRSVIPMCDNWLDVAVRLEALGWKIPKTTQDIFKDTNYIRRALADLEHKISYKSLARTRPRFHTKPAGKAVHDEWDQGRQASHLDGGLPRMTPINATNSCKLQVLW